MTFYARTGSKLPNHLELSAKSAREKGGGPSRREFLSMATAFGASAATAHAMLGTARPAIASTTPVRGGTARIQGELRAMKDPRTFDFNMLANFSRGWLEYLVQYENDGTFTPKLLESWEINDDATAYTLNVRPGVTWNDGTPFTAADVGRNIERFCDRSFEANSMASRFGVMIDPETNNAIPGTIEVVDDLTLRLNLPAPDISIIPSLAEYPAAIVPEGFDAATMLDNPIGTGPYLPDGYSPGVDGALVRNEAHTWWNADNGAWLDRIEFIDYGVDPAAFLSAADADEIDAVHATEGEFILLFQTLDGWRENEVVSAGTILARARQDEAPYNDVRVRRALALAVDNAKVLELGYAGLGEAADNHHVCSIHPEYADIGRPTYDPEQAAALMAEAGFADFEHDLISLNGGFWRDTADAIGAQIRDAGIPLKRTVIPSNSFWNNWDKYPFSVTNWNHRALGVTTLAIAYRTGEPWNEAGFENAEFDALVTEALGEPDLETRRALMAQAQQLMVDEGVIIQPYWRSMYNHCKANLINFDVHVAQEIRIDQLWWDQA
ncbi:MAG: ABC transporter substrate-binding protein [Pseudomonadota bacterium]